MARDFEVVRLQARGFQPFAQQRQAGAHAAGGLFGTAVKRNGQSIPAQAEIGTNATQTRQLQRDAGAPDRVAILITTSWRFLGDAERSALS